MSLHVQSHPFQRFRLRDVSLRDTNAAFLVREYQAFVGEFVLLILEADRARCGGWDFPPRAFARRI